MNRRLPLILSALLLGAAAVPTNKDPMSVNALKLKQSLTVDQQKSLCLPFASPERGNWRVLPYGEAGVRLDDMNPEARKALRSLCASVLSEAGLKTIESVRILDGILVAGEEARGQRSKFHGSERYFITLYGNPEGSDPWGWRMEGHHLSLNVTHKNDSWTSVAPFYVGSQPARVKEGKHKGLRLMGAEDDLARGLYLSLDEKQRGSATLSGTQPTNVVMVPARDKIDERGGIPWTALNQAQRNDLSAIVDLWIGRRAKNLAASRSQLLRDKQLEQLSFGWIGSTAIDAGHYWRIFGAGLTIEASAPVSDPAHVHTLWRDADWDLGKGQ